MKNKNPNIVYTQKVFKKEFKMSDF